MNDRFKFRFWDKETQTMQKIPRIELNHRITLDEIFADDRVIFMQCIGLKDKNGKLIYEGDILKTKEHNLCKEGELFEVFYQKTLCQFLGKSLTNGNCIDLCDLYEEEVISNIYENKELLESEG